MSRFNKLPARKISLSSAARTSSKFVSALSSIKRERWHDSINDQPEVSNYHRIPSVVRSVTRCVLKDSLLQTSRTRHSLGRPRLASESQKCLRPSTLLLTMRHLAPKEIHVPRYTRLWLLPTHLTSSTLFIHIRGLASRCLLLRSWYGDNAHGHHEGIMCG